MIADLIYDVGMNNGDDTAYYLARGYKVVAVEADPELCRSAAQRFARQIQTCQLTLLNVAIATQPGFSEFWICDDNSVWNSFFKENVSRDGLRHHSVQVPCETFSHILDTYGTPYFVKVDIEGHDYLCLDALSVSTDLPQYVSLEIGDIDHFLDKLTALGYSAFKLISQFNFLPVELPASREQSRHEWWSELATSRSFHTRVIRKLIGAEGRNWITKKVYQTRYRGDWFFPQGSSGPFGEDTPGRWFAAEDARRIYRHYSKLAQSSDVGPFWNDKSYSFWVDLHARRSVPDDVPGNGHLAPREKVRSNSR